MIVLDATTKSIVVAMSGAAATTNPDFVAAYSDNNGATFVEGSNDGALNGTSSVTMVAAPASSTRRLIKSLSIENKDTAAVTVTISYNNNSTLRTLYKVTLAVGDTWTTDGTFDTNGNLKQATTAGVVTFSGGTTGLTPSSATGGVVTLAGTLAVANGGTGITSFGTGVATFLGTPSSANLAAAVTDETGSGSLVFATSPTLVTPTLGVATATSVNKLAITAPATSATLAVADGKTLTASNSLTLAGTDGTTMTFPAASASVGYLNIPINSQSAAYTTVAADSGKAIYHPSTDANARTFTIDSNANVPYAAGTSITFINMTSQVVTIAIATDTMYLAGTGTTGNRSLAQYGIATAVKLDTTTWIISGNGLT